MLGHCIAARVPAFRLVTGLLLAALLPACTVVNFSDPPSQRAQPDVVPLELGTDLAVPEEGSLHQPEGTPISYAANPPASGLHWPEPAEPGFYTARVPTERWVHNLEHGHIVVLYDCRGECPADLLANLERFAGEQANVLVTPYDGLPGGVLLTGVAWTWQMHLPSFDEAALRGFYARHYDKGPEAAMSPRAAGSGN